VTDGTIHLHQATNFLNASRNGYTDLPHPADWWLACSHEYSSLFAGHQVALCSPATFIICCV